MGKESFLSRFQEFLGVTQNEATVALVLILGLSIGVVARFVSGEKSESKYNSTLSLTVYHVLDSIARADEKSNSGIIDTAEFPSGNSLDSLNLHSRYLNFTNKKKELPSQKVDLNSATKAELIRLPGIGEAMAERIISQRKNSPFSTKNDLMNVKGIGKKKFDKLLPYIIVGKK